MGIPPQPPVPPPPPSGPHAAPHWGGHTPSRTHVAVEPVGRYELLLELASGGMGSVYVGRQRGAAGFERLVAIKRMHPHLTQHHDLVLAFHEEARIASLIHHPNVVTVVDVYEEGGEHLLVMELIDGTSAGTLMTEARRRGKRLPRPVVLRLAIDVLAGLHAAHDLVGLDGTPLQVVHRDVSPQNILVGGDGAVRITDFGIARALQRLVHTATGELKGKLRYMPPEQAMGQQVDRRADVFSMAIVLWEMLAGDRLYKGETDLELLRAAGEAHVPRLSAVDPTTPAPLEAIIMQALARSPEHRFPTAAAFGAALERWAWEARELASAPDVARVVRELAGERIDARRRQLQDVLAGRRPAASRSGTHPLAPFGTPITSQAAILGPQSASPARRSSVLVGAIAAVAVAGAGLGLAALFVLRSAPSPAPGSVAGAPAEASAEADATAHVTVQVFARRPITQIRGDGVTGVTFLADGAATFQLPRGSAPVEVEVQFEDGGTETRAITPSQDVALRVTATPAASAAAPSAEASARASATASAPASPPRPATRPGGAPGDGLRKNPYQ